MLPRGVRPENFREFIENERRRYGSATACGERVRDNAWPGRNNEALLPRGSAPPSRRWKRHGYTRRKYLPRAARAFDARVDGPGAADKKLFTWILEDNAWDCGGSNFSSSRAVLRGESEEVR